MPKGPNGQKRPADAIGLAVMIGKIATGEVVEPEGQKRSRPSGHKERKTAPKAAQQS
jgi:hypothetical protein